MIIHSHSPRYFKGCQKKGCLCDRSRSEQHSESAKFFSRIKANSWDALSSSIWTIIQQRRRKAWRNDLRQIFSTSLLRQHASISGPKKMHALVFASGTWTSVFKSTLPLMQLIAHASALLCERAKQDLPSTGLRAPRPGADGTSLGGWRNMHGNGQN